MMTETMRAFITRDASAPLEQVARPRPEPVGTEVLIRTVAVGVCHSDVHLHEGRFDLGGGKMLAAGRAGLALGHEILGEVVALGPAATDTEIGDRIVIYPWIGCGDCGLCRDGREHLCDRGRALGIQKDGGFAEYILVPDARYLFDKGDTDDALSCTYACSGLTAYSALKKAGPFAADDAVMIVGLGGVGRNALQIARSVFGLNPVVADVDEEKLAEARSDGVALAINPGEPDAAREVLKRLGGVRAVIDFVGSEDSSRFAQRALRKGGVLVIVGLFGGTFSMPLPLIPMLERTIRGSYVGSLAEMGELMALVREGRIPPIPIECREASAQAATRALDDLREGRVSGRTVLCYTGK